MTTKKVKALIVVRNVYTEQIVCDNIEFDTEIDVLDTNAADIALVTNNYVAFLCNETKVKKNPDYDWAEAYVKAKTDELTRCYLEVIIVD